MAKESQNKKWRRNSLRHPEIDYSSTGAYFLTLYTRNHEPVFGSIKDGKMFCNPFGSIVWEVWESLPCRYPQISIDAAIVMPNHFHGIIIVHDSPVVVGEVHEPPLRNDMNDFSNPLRKIEPPLRHEQKQQRKMTIPLVIGYFKMNSAKRINLLRGTPGTPVWQRNYYDHILHEDRECNELIEYIFTNPLRWGIDKD